MVTQVGLSSAGTTFISGTASGLDTLSLIQNAKNIKLQPKKRYDDQVSLNLNKISGFQVLQAQAGSLKTAIDKLKNDLALGSTFDSKKVSLVSSSSTAASSILTASVSSTAQPGTNRVVVTQDARAFSANSATQSSITTALNATGSFQIGEAGKTAATISFTATSTIQDIANSINASTATSGVSADILQISTTEFQLVLRGADTGKAVTVSNNTGDNVLSTLGVVNGSNAFLDSQAARQAIITVNGSTIYSDSNTFSNVLTGLTINVTGSDPATTITLTIANDTDAIKTTIQSFISTYNTLRQTILGNQKVGADGVVDPNALLYNEFLNNQLGNDLGALLGGSYGSSTTYNNLRSLGITIDASNNLVLDTTTLDTALKNNLSDVKGIFTNSLGTGFADKLSAKLDTYSNFATGSIAKVIATLQTDNTTLTGKSADVQTSADAYEQYLIGVYANIESKIKKAELLKSQIKAIVDASFGQNN